MKNILSGNKITKYFGTDGERRSVLDGVSLDLAAGEFVCIMGPSGSGKSTLLYALSGMEPVDGGEVLFEGQPLSGLSDNALSDLRRNRMGFVFQQPALLTNLNILDNIVLPQIRDHRRSGKQLLKKAQTLMDRVGIGDLGQREITQVSGGQLQRAGICRALMCEPAIILGDEPTGALNSKAASEVMELFFQINAGGTAILLVTHDANVAAWAGRVLFMLDGKIAGQLSFSERGMTNHEARAAEITLQMNALKI